jgi:hypothetical protein
VTALPPDPDPANTPGASSGSVDPGDTPPDSAQTSATSNQDPPARRRMTPMAVASMIAIGILAAMFFATAVLMVLKIVGVFD